MLHCTFCNLIYYLANYLMQYIKILSEILHILGWWYESADWDILVCDYPSIYNVYVSFCGLLKDTFLETH